MVDRETGFVTDRLEKLGGQHLDSFVVEVFEHDMGVLGRIVEIEEAVVEVLLVVLGVDEGEHSRLTAACWAVNPHVRVTIGGELVAFLQGESLNLLAVLKVRPGKLLEGAVVVAGLNHATHLDQDVVDLALLFFGRAGGERCLAIRRTVLGKCTKLQQDGLSLIDLAELLDMVSTPSGERQIFVPWNEIVACVIYAVSTYGLMHRLAALTIPLLDLPTDKDTSLAVDGFEHDCDVDMADLVVVLSWLGSDLDTSNK